VCAVFKLHTCHNSGKRSFSYLASKTWGIVYRRSPTSETFKRRLKTHLFGYTKIILNILTQTARTFLDSTYNIDNVRLINVIFVGPVIKPSNRHNLKLL